ncbi:MAG: beta-lactamase family protein [Verrucomicrobiaceae bacterium]|nr:beta-lactamase family protein [Verrucomicrobiaceae bacterium]
MRSKALFWPTVFVSLTSAVADNTPATTSQPVTGPKAIKAIDMLIDEAVKSSKIPGAVIWLEQKGRFYHRAYGQRNIVPAPKPMEKTTIFDAASLTKVVATTPSVMVLMERGKLNLNDPVKKHIPEFSGTGKSEVTIRHLLTHTSGLPPILPRKPPWSGYTTGIKLATATNMRAKPGEKYRYSDVNFILLGEIVRRISGKSLKQFAREAIFAPLGMHNTGFVLNKSAYQRVAPTTREKNGLVQGIVHDPSARSMGGIAGHAGLFTTAPDLARYCRMITGGGTLGKIRILSKDTVILMTSTQTSPSRHKANRGLGWDIDSPFSSPQSKVPAPNHSFGHTGWTGGSIWIHPTSRSFLILLSNRNHPYERRSIRPLREALGKISGKALGLHN